MMAEDGVRLSVLDQAPVAEGSTAGEALERSVELAQTVEALGYGRFWMSEHHAMATLACSAPEVVLARIGAATRRIRIGSGGIMLPHYAPLKVAEVFRTLEAMYPGRVDLGVGRAPGGGPVESQALRRERKSLPADDFAEQMAELLAWLGQGEGFPEGHPFGRVCGARRRRRSGGCRMRLRTSSARWRRGRRWRRTGAGSGPRRCWQSRRRRSQWA